MNAIATTNQLTHSSQVFNTASGWELAQRMAKAFAASSLVPDIYRNNIPNCLIVLEISQRMGASPLLVAQNLYIVHGRPGWSAKFLIATFNECGRFTAIRYRFTGTRDTDSWGCIAYATDKATGDLIEGPEITIALAKAEGWYSKAGSKWKTMPDKMLRYRAAAWMVDTTAPELSMGLQTADTLEDMDDVPVMTVTQAGRDPLSLESLEAELLGEPEVANSDINQVIHDAMLAATDEDALNAAWEKGGPDWAAPQELVDMYNDRAAELRG